MSPNNASLEHFDPSAFHFYRRAFEILHEADIPFLLGGAYALSHYTGIVRHTKDLDLFVRGDSIHRTLEAFDRAGYRTELLFSHWLGKAYHGDDFVDIIFNSGNGLCRVDEAWFEHAVEARVFGSRVLLMPAEEMIWQKAFIMERERFDGADVLHLLRARGRLLDWDRLLCRFGPNWRVLFSHLVLFGFVYPDDQHSIPEDRFRELLGRFEEKAAPARAEPQCRGTFLSRMQYLTDIEEWNYRDPRLAPHGSLTKKQVVRWTDAGR